MEPGDAAARRAIERLVANFAAAWNAHDARAFALLFAEEVDFTNVFGVVQDGRAAVERSHDLIFSTIFRDSLLAVRETRIRFLRVDIAAVDTRWEMTGARNPNGREAPARHGLMNSVAVDGPDGWYFALFHNQDLLPPERVAEIGRQISTFAKDAGS